jgi:tetratricopeptide (TPR) repeat protein
MLEDTLKLMLAAAARTPAPTLAAQLDELFRVLAAPATALQAEQVEDDIWALWMEYPVRAARDALEQATQAISQREFEAAETRLDRLVEDYPDYAEAWNKRATLRFLQGRDADSVHDIQRTIALEPRHFGAICGFAQICLRRERDDLALFALQRAQEVHPTMASVKEAISQLTARRASGPLH